MRVLLFTSFLLCLVSQVDAQLVTIYTTDFTSLPDGSQSGDRWSSSSSNCDSRGRAGVFSGRFEWRDMEGTCGGPACLDGGQTDNVLEVGPISITGCTAQAVVSVAGSGAFECESPGGPDFSCNNGHDQLVIEYSLNGGPYTLFPNGYVCGGSGLGTKTITGLVGSTLSIRITGGNKAMDEVYFINSITIRGMSNVAVAINGPSAVCNGGSIDLTASPGFDDYQWSDGQSGQTISVTSPGTYKVTATTAGGCQATAMKTVTLAPAPTVTITGTTQLCDGGNGTLTVTQNFSSYEWSTGQTGKSIPIDAPGTYDVTVTDAAGCIAMKSFTVNGGTPPTVTINTTGGQKFVCSGSNLTLTASGAGITSYRWSTGATSSNIIVNQGDTYTVTVTNALGCEAEASVDIEAYTRPTLINPGVKSACGAYELQPINGTNLTGSEAYYTGPNGTGQSFLPGEEITSSRTIYIFDGNPGCTTQQVFQVVITPQPQLDDIPDQTACDAYILPPITGSTLTNGRAYYTGSNGTGTKYLPGDTIKTNRNLFIYDGTATCNDQETFSITITAGPRVNDLRDTSICGSFTLPPITGTNLSPGNSAYYTGPGATGTRLNPGAQIATSRTLYIYNGTATCYNEQTVTITITAGPQINPSRDTALCSPYTLPSITGTNLTGNQAYYTAPGGTGTRLNAGAVITNSQTLYAFDTDGNCSSQDTFSITIATSPNVDDLADVTECGFYVLPVISGTNLSGSQAYYTQANGAGTRFLAGDTIRTTRNLFIYDGAPGCSDEESVMITILQPPVLAAITDQSACGYYVLPVINGTNLSGNQAYFLQPNGAGTKFAPGDTIRTAGTYYIFDDNGSCSAERSFAISILQTPVLNTIADRSACVQFILPTIQGSNLSPNVAYFTQTNGGGMRFVPGDTIKTTTTLFAFDTNGSCSVQDTFEVKINPNPIVTVRTKDAKCNGAQDGAIELVIQGNVPFRFDWNVDNLDGQQNVMGVGAGTYTVGVRDTNNCSVTASAIISEPAPLELSCAAQTPASATNASDGTAQVILTNGSAPFTLEWSGPANGSMTINTIDTVTIPNLAGGAYTVTLTDANGCSTTCNFSISVQGCNITIDLASTDASCAAAEDGAITTTIVGAALPIQYDWNVDTLDGIQNPGNLAPGTYTLNAIDANNCIISDNVQIGTRFPLPDASISYTNVICENDCFIFDIELTGTPPFALDYQLSTTVGDIVGTLNIDSNHDTLVVCPASLGIDSGYLIIQFQRLRDANCENLINRGDTLFLKPIIRDTIAPILCSTDSVIVNGKVYNQMNPSGTETLIGAAANGCDSIITVNLSFYPPVIFDLNQTICETDSIIVNGTVYNFTNPSGTETLIGAAANGCDSIVNVNLQFFPRVTFDLTQTICESDSIVVNGTVYNFTNPSGTEILIGAAANGCDSIVNVNLQFFPRATFDLNQTICETDSIVVNGTVYNQANPSGTETLIGAAANGCDSIVNVTLQFFPRATFDLNQTICETDSIVVNGTVYNSANPSGAEVLFGAAEHGCDSTVNVNLQFFPRATFDLNQTICENDTIVVNGTVYNQANPSGTEILIGASANGCDSIVHINLQFISRVSFDLNQTVCENDSIVVNGTVYNRGNPSGTEIFMGGSVSGCDSLVNVNLSFFSPTILDLNQTLCEGDSLVVNGTVYNQTNPSGTETIPGGSINGCDSTINVQLTYLEIARTSIDTTLCPGESIVVNGIVYDINTTSGTETISGGAANGCDSVIQVRVRFFQPATFDLNATICETDSMVVNGTVYNQANPIGTETLIGASVNGCDSVVNVNLQFFPRATFDLDQTICENDSILVNGIVYNQSNPSGTETLVGAAVNGCDSIVNVNLQFFQRAVFDLNQTICENDSILVNGTVYNRANSSGTETLLGASANGCDSIVNIQLNFFPPAILDLNQTLCEGDSLLVNGTVYNQTNPSGTEILIGASINGCDSIININLTFLQSVNTIIDTLLCPGESLVVNGVTYNENRLMGTEKILGGAQNGCDSIVQVHLRYREAVTGFVEGSTSICAGDSATLTFRLSGAPTFEVRYSDGTNTFNLTNIFDGYTIRVAPNQTTTYNITFLSVNGTACPAQLGSGATVQVSNLTADVSVTTNYFGFGVSCADAADGALIATGSNGTSPITYRWNTGATTSQLTDVKAGTYTVTLTDAVGCMAIDSATVTQPQQLAVRSSTRSPVCANDKTGIILIDSISGGAAPYEVSLNGSSYRAITGFPHQIPNLAAGNFNIFVRDANDCETSFNTAILAPSEPSVDLGPDITLDLGDSVRLVGLANFTPSKIEWTPIDSLTSPNALSTFVHPISTTSYTITIADTSGCTATDQITVFVNRERDVFIPTAFTPDGDGINDFFFINAGNDVVRIKELRIFDRWGNMMFRRGQFMPNDPLLGWDGTFNGRKVNIGVYVYYAEIEFIDGIVTTFEGGITVVR